MAMLRNWDITDDINTGDPELINAAKDKLIELIDLVNVKVDITAVRDDRRRQVHRAPGLVG